MKELLKCCELCPRNCRINRYKNVGACGASDKVKVAYYSLHLWEEPIVSGENGSGTVFFSNCNLKCIFCQNKKISTLGYGKEISLSRLENIFLELQARGANNINLVTPTPYVPQIIKVLKKIKNSKLKIPVVYNTSSYENRNTIDLLNGLIDVYLADFKYFDDELGWKYSKCEKYFDVASEALEKMVMQTGKFKIKNNLICSGVIVRILVLPGHANDAKKIIRYLYEKYGNDIIISIMNQYTPIDNFYKYPNLNKKISEVEYNEVVDYAYDLGVVNAFIQEGDTQIESFIPDFNCNIV